MNNNSKKKIIAKYLMLYMRASILAGIIGIEAQGTSIPIAPPLSMIVMDIPIPPAPAALDLSSSSNLKSTNFQSGPSKALFAEIQGGFKLKKASKFTTTSVASIPALVGTKNEASSCYLPGTEKSQSLLTFIIKEAEKLPLPLQLSPTELMLEQKIEQGSLEKLRASQTRVQAKVEVLRKGIEDKRRMALYTAKLKLDEANATLAIAASKISVQEKKQQLALVEGELKDINNNIVELKRIREKSDIELKQILGKYAQNLQKAELELKLNKSAPATELQVFQERRDIAKSELNAVEQRSAVKDISAKIDTFKSLFEERIAAAKTLNNDIARIRQELKQQEARSDYAEYLQAEKAFKIAENLEMQAKVVGTVQGDKSASLTGDMFRLHKELKQITGSITDNQQELSAISADMAKVQANLNMKQRKMYELAALEGDTKRQLALKVETLIKRILPESNDKEYMEQRDDLMKTIQSKVLSPANKWGIEQENNLLLLIAGLGEQQHDRLLKVLNNEAVPAAYGTNQELERIIIELRKQLAEARKKIDEFESAEATDSSSNQVVAANAGNTSSSAGDALSTASTASKDSTSSADEASDSKILKDESIDTIAVTSTTVASQDKSNKASDASYSKVADTRGSTVQSAVLSEVRLAEKQEQRFVNSNESPMETITKSSTKNPVNEVLSSINETDETSHQPAKAAQVLARLVDIQTTGGEVEMKDQVTIQQYQNAAAQVILKNAQEVVQAHAAQHASVGTEATHAATNSVSTACILRINSFAIYNVSNAQTAGVAAGSEDAIISKGLWASGLYGTSKQGIVSNSPGYKGRTQGATIGFDLELGEDLLGIAYGNVRSNFKLKNKSSDKTSVIGHVVSLYGQKDLSKNFSLQVVFSVARNNISHNTTRSFAGVKYNASGKYKSTSYNLDTALNYNIFTSLATIIPNIGIRYGQYRDGAYNESNVGVQNLSISANKQNLLTGIIGTRIAFLPKQISESINITPILHGSIERYFNNKSQAINNKVSWWFCRIC